MTICYLADSVLRFFLVEDAKQQKEIYSPLFESQQSLDKIGTFFRDTTRKLITTHSFKLVGGKTCVVDIVRDVLKVVPVYWAADIVRFIPLQIVERSPNSHLQAGIELKTKENPRGDYTPLELYNMLSDIYSFIFLETEKSKFMLLQTKVQAHVESLLQHINANLGIISRVCASLLKRMALNVSRIG